MQDTDAKASSRSRSSSPHPVSPQRSPDVCRTLILKYSHVRRESVATCYRDPVREINARAYIRLNRQPTTGRPPQSYPPARTSPRLAIHPRVEPSRLRAHSHTMHLHHIITIQIHLTYSVNEIAEMEGSKRRGRGFERGKSGLRCEITSWEWFY